MNRVHQIPEKACLNREAFIRYTVRYENTY